MNNITIPIEVPSDLLILLNESAIELKDRFQSGIAIMLFQQNKITLGKAIQLSGLTRYEFEKSLAKNKIPVSNIDVEVVFSDLEKLKSI